MSNSLFSSSKAAPINRILARVFRSPRKRALQALKWISHYPAYHRLNQALKSRGISALAAANPEYRFKYLGNYLSPLFSISQRADILGHTYRFLASQRILPFRSVLAGGMSEFWACTLNGERFEAVISPMNEAFLEGDLTMVFLCNGTPLYRFSFSFLPGSIVGLTEPTALFIGGSQGYRGTLAESRRIAKVFGEICPATLLLILLRALSSALGLRSILGVSLLHHSCDRILSGEYQPLSAYDTFWQANGAERLGGFYHMASDLAFRPSEAASSAHRARARRKQERKMRLYTEMLAKFGVRQIQEPALASSDWKPAELVPA